MITLSTSDNKRFVDVGGTDIWKSIYSTAEARLGLYKNKVPLALDFLRTGNCEAKNSLETARQINLIHDKGYSPLIFISNTALFKFSIRMYEILSVRFLISLIPLVEYSSLSSNSYLVGSNGTPSSLILNNNISL